jgi:hypothetical protein
MAIGKAVALLATFILLLLLAHKALLESLPPAVMTTAYSPSLTTPDGMLTINLPVFTSVIESTFKSSSITGAPVETLNFTQALAPLLAVVAVVAVVADVAVVAEPADVADVAVAALPKILIFQVPDAPAPVRLGTFKLVCAFAALVAPVPP